MAAFGLMAGALLSLTHPPSNQPAGHLFILPLLSLDVLVSGCLTPARLPWRAATRLVRGGQNNRVPVLAAPTLLGVAYAFWKDLTAPFTIALMIGQVRAIHA